MMANGSFGVEIRTLPSIKDGPLFPPLESVFGGGQSNSPFPSLGVKRAVVHFSVGRSEGKHLSICSVSAAAACKLALLPGFESHLHGNVAQASHSSQRNLEIG